MSSLRKPKLFLSHSSDDSAVASRLVASLQDRFEDPIFLDVDGIRAGDDWRTIIEGAIADSDAAIVLLSPSVLARPFWVSNEAFVLSFVRRALGARLLVIPVLLPGFAKTDLQAPALAPAALDALQAIEIDPVADDLTALDDALKPIIKEFQGRSAYDWVERFVGSKLRGLDLHATELLADELGLARADLALLRDHKRWLACHLLRADLRHLEAAHTMLAELDRPLAYDVFRIVAPYCWVQEAAAAALAREALGAVPKKPVAMNAGRAETPRLYVRRASLRVPHWWILYCDGDFNQSPEVEEMVLDNIRLSLAVKLGFAAGESPCVRAVLNELAKSAQANDPIFVVLPPWFARMDGQLLTRLRDVFPGIAFLIWTEKQDAALATKFQDLVLLPELDPQDEQRIYRVYGRCMPGEAVA